MSRKEWYSCLAMIVVQAGRRTLKLFDRVDFDRALARFGEGEELELRLETLDRKRTSRQNRFFHGPVLKAFMTLGYSQEEAKDLLCFQFIPREIHIPSFEGDPLAVLFDTGMGLKWIRIHRVPGHTSTLTVEQFNPFLDSCIQYAAEQNIVIQDSEVWLAERAEERQRATLAAIEAGTPHAPSEA
jgi:hypothetical protein